MRVKDIIGKTARGAVAIACALSIVALPAVGPVGASAEPADSSAASSEAASAASSNASSSASSETAGSTTSDHGWQSTDQGTKYRYLSGKYATGLTDINDKTYYFDNNGYQLTGWRNVDGAYRFFTYAQGEKGNMVTNKVINGIMLAKSGVAVLNDEASAELEVLVKAQKCCDAHTSPADTTEEKMRKLFEWMVDEVRERSSAENKGEDGWQRFFALDIFDTQSGSCDSFAAGYAYLANAAGAEECAACASTGHGWAEVNNEVYDPEQCKQTDKWRYYAFPYESSGSGGSPAYASSRQFVAKLAPRDEAYGTITDAAIAEANKVNDTTGWVEREGAKCYYQSGKMLTERWYYIDGHRYFFQDDGKPVTGPASIDGTWYVFNEAGELQTGDGERIVDLNGQQFRVEADGRASSGWSEPPDSFFAFFHKVFGFGAPILYYLETGEQARGICYSGDKLLAFKDNGDYDEGRSNKLQDLAKKTDDASGLLAELGEPVGKDEAESCRPGYEGGTEHTYTYDRTVVRTFNAADGPEQLNYIEPRPEAAGVVLASAAGAYQPQAGTQGGSGITGDAQIGAQVAAFANEHGNDFQQCFEAMRYDKEKGDGFIRYGATGRPSIEGEFTNERILEEARTAFVDRTEGDCYTFTVALYCVAKQLGYEARPVAGTMTFSTNGSEQEQDTCWTELKIDGVWKIYDPLHADSLNGVPYGQYETVKRKVELPD